MVPPLLLEGQGQTNQRLPTHIWKSRRSVCGHTAKDRRHTAVCTVSIHADGRSELEPAKTGLDLGHSPARMTKIRSTMSISGYHLHSMESGTTTFTSNQCVHQSMRHHALGDVGQIFTRAEFRSGFSRLDSFQLSLLATASLPDQIQNMDNPASAPECIIAILGVSGAGKSTFINTICGREVCEARPSAESGEGSVFVPAVARLTPIN